MSNPNNYFKEGNQHAKKETPLQPFNVKLHPNTINAIKEYQTRHKLKSQGDVIEQALQLLLVVEKLAIIEREE